MPLLPTHARPLFSFACLTKLAFLGVMVREPFLVIFPDVALLLLLLPEAEEEDGFEGLEGFLSSPCAMLGEGW
jgi:hypothetical protein